MINLDDDLFGSLWSICVGYISTMKLEVLGFDANGGPSYMGSGCFHRRETLCGKKYEKNYKVDWKKINDRKVNESASFLEETCKVLASCTFEHNTPWGKEVHFILPHHPLF